MATLVYRAALVSLDVYSAQNQIKRSRGSFSKGYALDREMLSTQIRLQDGEVWDMNNQTGMINLVVIACEAAVKFTGYPDPQNLSNNFELVVNKLLVLDTPLADFSIESLVEDNEININVAITSD